MSAVKAQGVDPERQGGNRFRKTIFLLPNLLTAANMVLGILAITNAINDSLTLSLVAETKVLPFVGSAKLILAAIFLDFMDGRVARATGTTSKFGMEFDSLSDLVSFGLAPALLIYLSVLRYMTYWGISWGISIAVLYVVCAAVRLARFNVQAAIEEKDHFMGLPSPAAAGILVSYVLLSRWGGWYGKGIILNKVMGWYEENISFIEITVIPILMVVIALMMTSTIRYPSLKKWKWETVKPWTFPFIVLVLFWLFKAAELTSFVLLSVYLLWPLTLSVVRVLTRKGTEKPRPS